MTIQFTLNGDFSLESVSRDMVINLNEKTSESTVSRWIHNILNYFLGGFNEFKFVTAASIFWQLSDNTPVLTGRARASWAVGVNGVPFKAVPRQPKGTILEPPKFDAPKKIRITDNYVIGNDAPYIERLNEGWSMQAPAGFIEISIATGIRAAEQLMASRL